MRASSLGLSLALFASACAPTSDLAAESATTGELSDDDLAKRALRALGAKVDGAAENRCQGGCHDINQGTLNKWALGYRKTLAKLADTDEAVGTRVNAFKRDPTNPNSSYAPQGLGFIAAGVKLSDAPDDRAQPKTAALRTLLAAFFGSADEQKRFADSVSMPLNPNFPRLSAEEMESVLAWVDRGMPEVGQYLPEPTDWPTKCTEDLSWAASHARDMQERSWASVNRDNQLPMFACEPGAAPLDCFQQRRDGKDVFPKASSSWVADGSTLRLLDTIEQQTYFWMRTSADGRFVANGLSLMGIDGGNISDLSAKLTGGTRNIFVAAKEDPDFSPDNRGFMFQSEGQGAFCPQSLLTDPSVSRIEPLVASSGCTNLGPIGLYETIAQPFGDDQLADRFVSTGNYVDDNGTYGDLNFDPGAALRLHVLRPVDNGVVLTQVASLPMPYEGDAIMSRSSEVIASRVAGKFGQLGYSIRHLTATRNGSDYDLATDKVGSLCMQGSKATFSFDERFLTMHRYMYVGAGGAAQYADVWVVDLLTGEKRRVTKMSGGTFALYPHFRSDGWLYFLVRKGSTSYVVASDAALRMAAANP